MAAMHRLNDMVVVLTGASSGIGASIAESSGTGSTRTTSTSTTTRGISNTTKLLCTIIIIVTCYSISFSTSQLHDILENKHSSSSSQQKSESLESLSPSENMDIHESNDNDNGDGSIANNDTDDHSMSVANMNMSMHMNMNVTTNKINTKTSNSTSSSLCHQTYFWGGGKAGSTTLYLTLVRGPGGKFNSQNHGPFPQKIIGKEPCPNSFEWKEKWEKITRDTQLCNNNDNDDNIDMNMGTGMRCTHVLNGCPRVTTKAYAKQIMALAKKGDQEEEEQAEHHPTFLMLVRDPVDRLVSFFNDQVRRGGRRMDIEQVCADAANNPRRISALVYQGQALQNLLSVVKDKHKILIIPMESMTIDSQGVVDAVMDHLGGKRWIYNTTDGMEKINRGDVQSKKNKDYKYTTLSNRTTEALRDVLRDDVLLLERLVGKRFSWSSWAHNETGYVDEDVNWLVTTPSY